MADFPLTKELSAFVDWDKRLVRVAKSIKVLSKLDWPEHLFDEFHPGWRDGNPKLPDCSLPKVDYREEIAELQAIADGVDRKHPIGEFLWRTATSYMNAAMMLEHAGTPAFTELSKELYGAPTDPIGTAGGLTHLAAAEQFLDMTRGCLDAQLIPESAYCLTPQHVAERVRETLVPFFGERKIEIEIVPDLPSKSSAGSTRIRLRDRTCFSEMDIHQLIQHEGFVHMLTAINGRSQPYLGSLGLNAPRTTRSQEGLATFGELITRSIDLGRLRRIALRIRAVHLGLQGADFIEIYRFFLGEGQDEKESFYSAGRVFRGGDPRGGVVFTKDTVYLQGLIFTHTFLRKALQANRLDYISHLMAGRLQLGDAIRLDPFFKSGFLAPPKFEPPWLQEKPTLAAYLCYSVFIDRINLNDISLEDFVTRQI